jgi:hypothetical protein
MTIKTAKRITAVLVFATPIIWLLWDWYAVTRFGVDATESHLIWSLYLQWHPFALLLMLASTLLIWHFFLQ